MTKFQEMVDVIHDVIEDFRGREPDVTTPVLLSLSFAVIFNSIETIKPRYRQEELKYMVMAINSIYLEHFQFDGDLN